MAKGKTSCEDGDCPSDSFLTSEERCLLSVGVSLCVPFLLFFAALPATHLSDAIEKRVNCFLEANANGEAGNVTIRVLSSVDKNVEVKPGMKQK